MNILPTIARLNVPGVYKIEILGERKVYIGTSKNILDRVLEHIRLMGLKLHTSKSLNHEIEFTIEILEKTHTDLLYRLARELFWTEKFRLLGYTILNQDIHIRRALRKLARRTAQ